jgi:hypothetical protein
MGVIKVLAVAARHGAEPPSISHCERWPDSVALSSFSTQRARDARVSRRAAADHGDR